MSRIHLRLFFLTAALCANPQLDFLQAQAPQVRFADFDIRTAPTDDADLKSPPAPNASVDPRARIAAYLVDSDDLGLASARFTLGPDGRLRTLAGQGSPLSAPSAAAPDTLAAAFLSRHADLFGWSPAAVAGWSVNTGDHAAGLALVRLLPAINGIPIFDAGVTVALTPRGEVTRVLVEAVPAVSTAAAEFPLTPAQAALRILQMHDIPAPADLLPAQIGRPHAVAFAHPLSSSLPPLSVEPVLFPETAAVLRPAYRIFLAVPNSAMYEIVLDADGSRLLYRRDLTSSVMGRVFMESPDRGEHELIPFPDDWVDLGITVSAGNYAIVIADRDGDFIPDTGLPDFDDDGFLIGPGSIFDFAAGDASTGDDPRDFVQAAVTNLFYLLSLMHDHFEDLGFDAQAGNFELRDVGIGAGGDPVVGYVQSSFAESRGGAAFLTPPDGVPGLAVTGFRRRADLPGDFEVAYAGDVVVHEYTHGVSQRLVGGPDRVSCLDGLQPNALSEGWSDYFANSRFDDPVIGEYIGDPQNGVRRAPLDQTYPFTFADLGNTDFEPHDDGEIWAATLWDVRQALGREVADQLLIDGLKMTPCYPSMVDARDAILAADAAVEALREAGAAPQGAIDTRALLWQAFAAHGLGFSAGGDAGRLGEGMHFTAAFDLPPDLSVGNRGPVVSSSPPAVKGAFGQEFVYPIQASDPDGDPLRYALLQGPPGMTVDPNTGVINWTVGFTTAVARIEISDGQGGRGVHGFRFFVQTMLNPDQPISISAAEDSLGTAFIRVPQGALILQVTLRGGAGDADIGLLDPGGDPFDVSENTGSDETLTVINPRQGLWTIGVHGFSNYSGVELRGTLPEPQLLEPNAQLSGLSDAATGEQFYKIVVPAEGEFNLLVSTSGGTGDVDLLLRNGLPATCTGGEFSPCEFDEWSIRSGNDDSIQIDNAAPGEWHITLLASDAYQGVELQVTLIDLNPPAPAINEGGVVHAASFAVVVAPGGIASLFGTNLAAAQAEASEIPLPTTLGGIQVKVDGVPAPLFFVSPLQINFQVPFESLGQDSISVTVCRDELESEPVEAPLDEFALGVFTFALGQSGLAPIVIHLDGSLVTPDSPAQPGEFLLVFATGLGGLDNAPATGEASPGGPLAASRLPLSATIGGVGLTTHFAGLTPGFVGLVQFNLELPPVLPPGASLTLRLEFVGSSSPALELQLFVPGP